MNSSPQWIREQVAGLQQSHLFRTRRELIPRPDGWCELDGRLLKNFASNDYLGLATDPRLAEAAQRAATEFGVGSGASPLVSGRTRWHARLEERIARFEGAEACLLFPSGYAANVGVLPALVRAGDHVYSDQWNHASLIDGCRLSGAEVHVYRHSDMQHLATLLDQTPSAGRRLIVTDSLFSVDGDAAPLKDICRLADEFDTMLVVDEAHATGVYGAQGRGLAESMHLEPRILLRIATLSKAIGAQGGFAVGDQSVIDWLWNRARSQVFSTALPPAVCAAAYSAFDIIETEPFRKERLWEFSRQFVDQLFTAGLNLGVTTPAALGPIVPVLLDDPQSALRVAQLLQEDGFLVGIIRPPSVPPGTSRLRITLSCAHTEADVQRLAELVVGHVSRAETTERRDGHG